MINKFKKDINHINTDLLKKGDFSLEVTLTDECNFRCAYCFEGVMCDNKTSFNCADDLFNKMDEMLSDEWFMSVFKGRGVGQTS